MSQAALFGRDITFDQFGKYNLVIRSVLEAVYMNYEGSRETDDFKAFEVYLKRVWFSNGIYHHYGSDKFKPGFTPQFFINAVKSLDCRVLPLADGQSVDELCDTLVPVIFDPDVYPVKVCKKSDVDLVQSSACNFYENVTQKEVEDYYASMKKTDGGDLLSYGLNTTVVKNDGKVSECVWKVGGKYGAAIEKNCILASASVKCSGKR